MSAGSTWRAAGWMAGWLLLMTLLPISGRALAGELDMIQVTLLRSVIGLVMVLPLVRLNGGFAAVRTRRLGLHVARNLSHYLAQYGWLVAITLIPLAQVVAIEFTMPIWTALLAVAALGERMRRGRVAAVLLGLLGVLVIVRPGASAIEPGQWIALSTAVGFALSVTMVKSLTRTDSVLTILFWMVVIQSVIGLVPALAVWRWPSAHAWAWASAMAFAGTFSHYCMASALRHADAMVVVPMDFLRVPLTALVGWLLYAEAIDAPFVIGAMLILAGNALNLGRSSSAGRASGPDRSSSPGRPA